MFRMIDSIAMAGEGLFLLLGRICIGVLFVPGGYGKLTNLEGFSGMLAGKGLPVPMGFAVVGALIEFLGGILIIVGFKTRLVALCMIAFVIMASLISHPYWIDPTQRIQFYKNLAIIGGFLYVFVRGAGSLSVDRR